MPVIGPSLVYPAMILVFDLLRCFSDDLAVFCNDSCLWPSKVFLVVFFKLVIPVIGLSLVYPAMILVFDLLKCFSDDLALSSNDSCLWPSKVF
jgi:hypothetical protein